MLCFVFFVFFLLCICFSFCLFSYLFVYCFVYVCVGLLCLCMLCPNLIVFSLLANETVPFVNCWFIWLHWVCPLNSVAFTIASSAMMLNLMSSSFFSRKIVVCVTCCRQLRFVVPIPFLLSPFGSAGILYTWLHPFFILVLSEKCTCGCVSVVRSSHVVLLSLNPYSSPTVSNRCMNLFIVFVSSLMHVVSAAYIYIFVY